MNPVHFFEKFNCCNYNYLFYSQTSNLYFNFVGVQDGEQCVFADADINTFAFSTRDADGSTLTPDSALFPALYGWPEIDDCSPDTLVIRWEDADQSTSYNAAELVQMDMPVFSDKHYSMD